MRAKKRIVSLVAVLALLIGLIPSGIQGAMAKNKEEDQNPTVTFELNGIGKLNSTPEVGNNGKVTKPEDPTDENAEFLGWFDKDNKAFNFKNTKITANTTIYAKWRIKKAQITGIVLPEIGESPEISGVKKDDTLPYYEIDYLGTYYATFSNGAMNIRENTPFVAGDTETFVVTLKTKNDYIIFDDSSVVTFDGQQAAIMANYSRNNYFRFSMQYQVPSLSCEITVLSDKDGYEIANFMTEKTFTLEQYESQVTPPFGKELAYWKCELDGGGYTSDEVINPVDGMVFYPVWQEIPVKEYSISFGADENAPEAERSVEKVLASEQYTLPECPYDAPKGMEFSCWKCAQNNGTYAIGEIISDLQEDMFFYPVWTELPPATYTIIEGADQTWTRGISDSGVTIVSDAPFGLFVKVEIDGTEVDTAYYTAVEGSTKITLSQGYLGSLASGEHEVAIVSTNGSAKTSLTIADSYIVAIHENVKDQGVDVDNYPSGSDFTLPNCAFTAPDGKEFDAWECVQNGNTYAPGNMVSVDQALDFYPVWKDIVTDDDNQPGDDDADQPGGDDADQPGDDDADQPGDDDADQPGGDDADQPSGDDADQPSGDDADQPSGDDADQPGGDDVEQPSDDNSSDNNGGEESDTPNGVDKNPATGDGFGMMATAVLAGLGFLATAGIIVARRKED